MEDERHTVIENFPFIQESFENKSFSSSSGKDANIQNSIMFNGLLKIFIG